MQSSHELNRLTDTAFVQQPTPVVGTTDRLHVFPLNLSNRNAISQRAVPTWSKTQSNRLKGGPRTPSLRQQVLTHAQVPSFGNPITTLSKSPTTIQALPNISDNSLNTFQHHTVLPMATVQADKLKTPGNSSNMFLLSNNLATSDRSSRNGGFFPFQRILLQ